MATCILSGTLVDPSSTAISGVLVSFNTQNPTLSADPVEGSTTTAADGTWSLTIQQSLSGVVTINTRTNDASQTFPYRFNVRVPAAPTATFAEALVDT